MKRLAAVTFQIALCFALAVFFFLPGPKNAPHTAFAQSGTPDCSFTFTFTTSAVQTGQANLSASTPCVNWGVSFSVTGTLAATVQLETSPDNSTWTAVPNTICSSAVQPPCVQTGANPLGTLLTQGSAKIAAYGAYVRLNVTATSGSGTGTIRVYGYKGTSAAVGGSPGGIGPPGPTGPTGPAGGGGSVGAAGAVQVAAAANTFADSGCTAAAGSANMSCAKYVSTGSGAGSLATLIANAGSTGTTAKLLSKINSSGNAVIATTTDTAVPVWITLATDATIGCTAGTTGNACFVSAGQGTCTADAGGITAGHFVINSTVTNGRCRDGGTTTPSVYVVGVAQTAAAANADAVVQVASGGGSIGPAGPTGATGPSGGTGPAGTTGNANGITVYSGLAGVSLTGATVFFPIGGGSIASATETVVQAKINAATTFSNFGAQLSVALGATNSVALTFRKNTTGQTLTCTITDPAVTCSDVTHSFTVAVGDLVDIQAVFTGTIVATPTFVFATQAGVAVVGPTGPTGPTGGGGGSSVASTAFASLPGTCTSGSLYLFTDAAYTSALCGASNTYQYFTGYGLATPPPLAGWTGDNMLTATAGAAKGMWRIANAATAAATTLQAQYRPVPGSTYTLDVQILPETGQQTGCSGVQSTGIGVRDSGGKYITLNMGSGFTTTTGLNYMFDGRWNSATSRNNTPDTFGNVAQNTTLKFQSPYFIRMVVDATNVTFSTSYNYGVNWIQFSQIAWGAFLADITSNVFETSNECANVVASSLLSWLEH